MRFIQSSSVDSVLHFAIVDLFAYGDLRGPRNHLDEIAALGATAITAAGSPGKE